MARRWAGEGTFDRRKPGIQGLEGRIQSVSAGAYAASYGLQLVPRMALGAADDAEQAARENDLILFALCRTPHHPIGPLDFWGAEATSVWGSNCCDSPKTLVVSFGSPYFYRYYTNSGVAYVNAYSTAPQVLGAFVKAVIGRIPFAGKSPVMII